MYGVGQQTQNTKLSGTLPTELGTFSHLQDLKLGSQDRLSGSSTISTIIASPRALLWLPRRPDLCVPTLLPLLARDRGAIQTPSLMTFAAGTLPSEIGLCTDMVDLNTNYAALSGTLPSELAALSEAREFKFGGAPSSISGTIPTQLNAAFPKMMWLGFEHMRLSGTIPIQFVSALPLTRCGAACRGPGHRTWPIRTPTPRLGSPLALILQSGRFFRLEGNYLSGTIPTQIGGLSPALWMVRLAESERGAPMQPAIALSSRSSGCMKTRCQGPCRQKSVSSRQPCPTSKWRRTF